MRVGGGQDARPGMPQSCTSFARHALNDASDNLKIKSLHVITSRVTTRGVVTRHHLRSSPMRFLALVVVIVMRASCYFFAKRALKERYLQRQNSQKQRNTAQSQ